MSSDTALMLGIGAAAVTAVGVTAVVVSSRSAAAATTPAPTRPAKTGTPIHRVLPSQQGGLQQISPAPTGQGAVPTVNLVVGSQSVSTGGAVGAQFWIAIPGGGTFTYVNSQDHDQSSLVQTPGYPLATAQLPTTPMFLFTTPALTGEVDLLWTDAQGATHTSVVNYAP